MFRCQTAAGRARGCYAQLNDERIVRPRPSASSRPSRDRRNGIPKLINWPAASLEPQISGSRKKILTALSHVGDAGGVGSAFAVGSECTKARA